MSKAFIIARMKEASTWRAIIVLLIACGIPIAPALADQIISVGLAVVALIGIFTPDTLGKP